MLETHGSNFIQIEQTPFVRNAEATNVAQSKLKAQKAMPSTSQTLSEHFCPGQSLHGLRENKRRPGAQSRHFIPSTFSGLKIVGCRVRQGQPLASEPTAFTIHHEGVVSARKTNLPGHVTQIHTFIFNNFLVNSKVQNNSGLWYQKQLLVRYFS